MAYKEFNGNESAKGKGFDGNPQNINRNGQKPAISLKKKFSEIYADNEPVIWLDAKDVQEKEVDGRKLLGFKLPALDSYVIKLAKLANGKNDRVSLDVIKFLWEQHDGKAKQSVEHSGEIVAPVAPTILFNTKKK